MTCGDRPVHAGVEHCVKLVVSKLDSTAATNSRRHVSLDLRRQCRETPADVFMGRSTRQQSDAAIDVIADTARRDNTILGTHCYDAADRETIALVDVRHRQHGLLHPRKSRGIDELLQRALRKKMLDHLATGV